MSNRGELLVAILNKQLDFAILREKHWYRIPVRSVEKWLKDRWPPKWLAFYQTKAFGEESHAIHYFAQVHKIDKVYRWQLFPNEPQDSKKSRELYYQIYVKPIQRLPKPIYSRRFRRIVFIPTTWQKFISAVEINDLYDESSLEDRLWVELKHLHISAERQEFIKIKKQDYALDFAIYCTKGNIDVETDGDFWHTNPERAAKDYPRDNDLETAGWKLLRFKEHDLNERMKEYVIPTIVENIGNLGNVDEGRIIPRKVSLENNGNYQLSLFDDLDGHNFIPNSSR